MIDNAVGKALYEGNGATVDFPFPFRVWDVSQLAVSVEDPEGVTASAVGWSVTLSENGGTVHYMQDEKPLPAGWKLAIIRNMPFVQDVDLITGTRFDPQVIEEALDKATAERQQLLEQLNRAVILPPTGQTSPDELIQSIMQARADSLDFMTAAGASAEAAAQKALATAGDAQRAEQAAEAAGESAAQVADAAALGSCVDALDARFDEGGVILPQYLPAAPIGYPGEFRSFYEQTPPAGWAVRNGDVLEAADTAYPDLWAALQLEANAWKCKTAEEWTALSEAAGGVGGVPFFVLDTEAKTIRLPDTRGDYERGAGSDFLPNVGDWHEDAMRDVSGIVGFVDTSSVTPSGPFGKVTSRSNYGMADGAGKSSGQVNFVLGNAVPTADEARTRAFAVLPCVYVGLMAEDG